MDKHLHWLKDCEAQEQFRIHWRPGKSNLADYWTKYHAPAYHINIKAEFLTKIKDLNTRTDHQNASYKGVLNFLLPMTNKQLSAMENLNNLYM
jgi:hypothetical protein